MDNTKNLLFDEQEKEFVVPTVSNVLGVEHKHMPEPDVELDDNDLECGGSVQEEHYLQVDEEEALLGLPLDERMEELGYTDYADFFMDYPELITTDELIELLERGEIYTQDDVIMHNGEIIENPNSEDFEDFEYEFDEDY